MPASAGRCEVFPPNPGGGEKDDCPLFSSVFRDAGNQDEYHPPHWLDADLNGRAEREFPVAYRREATMRLGAGFKWSGQQGLLPSLQIRGTNPEGYDFLADIADPNKITINGETLSFTDDAAKAFADTIEHFDTFDLTWEYSIDNGVVWTAAGETKNQVYTLWDSPLPSTILYHTVAHVATKMPSHMILNSAPDVVDAVWAEFADRNVSRVDGTLMAYNHDDPIGQLPGSANSLAQFLAYPAPAGTPAKGRCTAWAEFLVATLGAHGIAASSKRIGWDLRVADGPAQGSGGNYPITAFNFHQIVRVAMYPDRIYDPSYGGAPTVASGGRSINLTWEDDHLVERFDGGAWIPDVKGVLELWYE